MRVVVLTHNADRHYYFTNTLIEQTGAVVGVITGAKRSRPSAAQRKKRYAFDTLKYKLRNKALNALFYADGQKLKAEKDAAEAEAFAGARDKFERLYSHLRLAEVEPGLSVNDPRYVDLIRAAKPDAVCVMGTCLIRKGIVEAVPWILNIHTGLSPYYRGGLTNLWPFVEGDYGVFGVTVHRLSLGIDSGDIIYTARPDIRPDDTFPRINTRCIQLGTKLMVRALKDLDAGKLETVKQWEKGKLFFDRDYNHLAAHRYFQKRAAYLAEYVRLQAAGELPTLRLITNGR